MSSVLTPRSCRTAYSSSPKSSPTGPTTRTSVKNDAASEKCTAEPPSMRSRCPNGVCTASNAIEPTTTRLMRVARLAECNSPPRDRRGLHDRRRRLAEHDEVVDDLLEVAHVAHVALHEVTVVTGHAMALDHLGRVASKLRDVRELTGCGPHADDHGEAQPERARIEVGVIRADDAVAFEPLQAFRDRGR